MGMAVQSNRHDVFKVCVRWWTHMDEVTELSVQWRGHLLGDLEALRKLDRCYPVEASMLKLHVDTDGLVDPASGGLSACC
ncbi:hypothetical protein Plhal304r1_c029g0094851 [Plasmopara halstedii]